ncbi:hypothetical protein FOA52_004781 [Chlamydomonas sp. UWO 241]|nr:hypothetical protein FOA52_004781 [Chlamydomonas sp. UWO 241]
MVEAALAARAAAGGAGDGTAPPLIVYFTASWCGPCKMVTKELNRVLAVKKVDLLCVDVDEEKEFSSSLGVRVMPTLMFVGSAPADSPAITIQGVVTKALLWDVLDNKLQFAGADLRNPRRL